LKGSTFFILIFLSLFPISSWSQDFFQKSYLGEKRLDSYSERYHPLIFQDIYRGQLTFVDEIFFQDFLTKHLFAEGPELSFFINSELYSAQNCTNHQLGMHFDDIRYSYRLLTFSYLLEGVWHLSELAKHFNVKACDFNLSQFMKSCSPQGGEMKKFVTRLQQYSPKYQDRFPRSYTMQKWWEEYFNKNYTQYSHYKMNYECGKNCVQSQLQTYLEKMCGQHQDLMKKICSEKDEIWGLSSFTEAYHLLSTSNIIATYNKSGEAAGCLRRFSGVMSNREPNYPVLQGLFPVLYDYLKRTHKDRFLQGRVFFYGAAKEYEEKGLADIWVKDQTLIVEKAPELVPEKPELSTVAVVEEKKEEPKVVEEKVQPEPVKVVKREVPVHPKSAFLQAAEVRRGQNLDRLAVDMLKFKYDYVFTLSMTNTLSKRLKTFMTQEALKEMANYDKLGSKEGPVPLLFIKFMIDYQEHQGLWNLISILGTTFYVSNEIDSFHKPAIEKIELLNDASTDNTWKIFVVKP